MNKPIIILLLLIVVIPVLHSEGVYDTARIPDELKNNASAVVRYHEEQMDISSVSSATGSIRHAVTILNKSGDEFGVFYAFYDRFISVGNIKITIYDSSGDVFEKVRSIDIDDYSAASGYAVFEDSRIKYYEPAVGEYPYTVEYEYNITYKGLFNLPFWQPVEGYALSVEKSLFRITAPSGFGLRYLESNIDNHVSIQPDNGMNVYSWTLTNYPAVEEERYSPPLVEITPVVYTAPLNFEIDGYKGNMSSWEEFGKWVINLNEGRDVLPDEARQKVREIVEKADGRDEIIRKIYRFVQSHTRYVSLQEGIGGWQPMPAAEVATLGYGDCKALTNYTRALLKEAGIKSYYTKVRAGSGARDIITDFVSNQSNHVFLCVPDGNDTIWLECTSQVLPFGYTGSFTNDRHVVVITDDGGKVVRSKSYPGEQNTQFRKVVVNFLPENKCRAVVSTESSGLQFEDLLSPLLMSYEDQEKWLYSENGLPNSNIENFSFTRDSESASSITCSQEIMINNYASLSGKRMFVPINVFNQAKSVPPEYENRKNVVELNYPYVDIDSVIMQLPEGYTTEYVPKSRDIKNQFGEFSTIIEVNGNNFLYVRTRKMSRGTFPASEYPEFRSFVKEIVNADKEKLVLVRKE